MESVYYAENLLVPDGRSIHKTLESAKEWLKVSILEYLISENPNFVHTPHPFDDYLWWEAKDGTINFGQPPVESFSGIGLAPYHYGEGFIVKLPVLN